MFFLKGSRVSASARASASRPFFSRRIGLYAGSQVPVKFGAKLYGRSATPTWLSSTSRRALSTIPAASGSRPEPARGAHHPEHLRPEQDRVDLHHGSPTGERNSLAGFDSTTRRRSSSATRTSCSPRGRPTTGMSRRRGVTGLWLPGRLSERPLERPDGLTLITARRSTRAGIHDASGDPDRLPGASASSRGRRRARWSRIVPPVPLRCERRYIGTLAGVLETRRLSASPLASGTPERRELEAQRHATRRRPAFDFEVAEGVGIPAARTTSRTSGSTEHGRHRPIVVDAATTSASSISGHYDDVSWG